MNRYFIFLFLLSAFTSNGQVHFQREYSSGKRIIAKSIVQNEDSPLMVVGNIDTLTSQNQYETAFLKKIDNKGNLIWTKYYSFPDAYGLFFNKIKIAKDGNYFVIGSISYGFGVGPSFVDIFIGKIDTSGTFLWSKRNYGGVGLEEGFDLIEHSNGDLSIFSSFGYEKNLLIYNAFQIIRTNALGDSLWTKEFYNNDEIEQFPSKFDETSDGGFILTGSCSNANSTTNGLLIKTNSSGDTLWTLKLDTLVNADIIGVVPGNGSFTIIGNMDSSFNNVRPFIASFSNSGVLNWFRFMNLSNTRVYSVATTSDGGFAWLCAVDSKNTILKTDGLGNPLWINNLHLSTEYIPSEIIFSNDLGFVSTGSANISTEYSFYLSKIKDSSLGTTFSSSFNDDLPISIFPIPTTSFLEIVLEPETYEMLNYLAIRSINGQMMFTIPKSSINNNKIDISSLYSGLYTLSLIFRNSHPIKTILFVKQ